MISFTHESWAQFEKDALPIWSAHYEEIAEDKQMPMRPDAETYARLDTVGQLQVVAARSSGQLVGYMLFFIRTHLHYADVLCGFEDAYFLLKDHRKGFTGINLIRHSIKLLKQRGVKRIFVHTKKNKDLGRVLKFLKMRHCDEVYTSWIGE